MTNSCVMTVLVGVLLATPTEVACQAYQSDSVFVGVTSVVVLTLVSWDDRIERASEEAFRQQLEDSFELGVLRAGVKNEAPSVNALACSIQLVWEDGLVIYTRSVEFFEYLIDRESFSTRLAQTWFASSLGTVGVNNLSGGDLGTDCAEQFELAWRRVNPR